MCAGCASCWGARCVVDAMTDKVRGALGRDYCVGGGGAGEEGYEEGGEAHHDCYCCVADDDVAGKLLDIVRRGARR
jgi:hypothetical protein